MNFTWRHWSPMIASLAARQELAIPVPPGCSPRLAAAGIRNSCRGLALAIRTESEAIFVRRKQEFERAERECLKRAKHICQARVPNVCMVRAVQAHHKKLRSQGGDNSQDNLLATCRDCHVYLHNHPVECYENGTMTRRDQ